MSINHLTNNQSYRGEEVNLMSICSWSSTAIIVHDLWEAHKSYLMQHSQNFLRCSVVLKQISQEGYNEDYRFDIENIKYVQTHQFNLECVCECREYN
jgi:hypothetical protein